MRMNIFSTSTAMKQADLMQAEFRRIPNICSFPLSLQEKTVFRIPTDTVRAKSAKLLRKTGLQSSRWITSGAINI